MAKKTTSGKFYQDRKNGPWRIDTRINIDGKYYHIEKRGFATKHEAQAAYDSIIQIKIEQVRAATKAENEMLFEQFCEEFIKFRSKKVCSSTTNGNDFYLMRKYFHPVFDGKPISKVFAPKTFIAWYDDLASNTAISETRRNKAIRLAKSMLCFADRRELISAEAYRICVRECECIKEPHREQKEQVLWNEAQRAAFLASINTSSPDFVMFSLFIETAPRIGEFLGLTADCFDFGKKQIRIKQQVIYESNGEFTLTNRLKSDHSYRTIPVSSSLANLLQRYIAALSLGPRDFLFGPWGSHAIPLSRTEFRRKLQAYCKKAGVPTPNPHAFRHMLSTALSRQYRNTADIENGAAIMGHSASVELNIYCHNSTPEEARRLLFGSEA